MELEEYDESDRPKYAILSHTWSKDEVLFRDWPDPNRRRFKAGYRKISLACKEAQKDGLGHLWVDTSCIDKSSSAELSEAINSMYAWYRDSEVCYAFLEDVPNTSFEKSRWFTRGWTLQELIAPRKLIFYSGDWEEMGDKWHWAISKLRDITGIRMNYLRGTTPVTNASIAERMSWLSNRTTTRPEDMAYCMLGIFDINIPLLYGEGSKAFIRVQEELIRVSNDQSIFSWRWNSKVPRGWASMLAPSPSTFSEAGYCWRPPQDGRRPVTYTNTNAGLSIRLPMLRTWSYSLAVLDTRQHEARVAIPVQGSHGTGVFERVPILDGPVQIDANIKASEHDVFIPRDKGDQLFAPARRRLCKYGVLVCFDDTQQYTECSSYPRHSFDETSSIFPLESDKDVQGGFLKLKPNASEINGLVILFERRGTIISASVMPDSFVDMEEVDLAWELEQIESSKVPSPFQKQLRLPHWKLLKPAPERVTVSISLVRPFLKKPDIVMASIGMEGSQRKDAEDYWADGWDSDVAEPGFMIQ